MWSWESVALEITISRFRFKSKHLHRWQDLVNSSDDADFKRKEKYLPGLNCIWQSWGQAGLFTTWGLPNNSFTRSPEIPHKLPCGAKWVRNGESVTNAGRWDGAWWRCWPGPGRRRVHLARGWRAEQSDQILPTRRLNLSRCSTAGRLTAMCLSLPSWRPGLSTVQWAASPFLPCLKLPREGLQAEGWGYSNRGGGEVRDVSEGAPGGGLWDCHQGGTPVL